MNQFRRKLLNATLFFAKKTRKVNTTKLCKLLYFFDFTIFKQTGYPAIGLRYHAFERGPVPMDFWLEVKDGVPPVDFTGRLSITKYGPPDGEYRELVFNAKAAPDMKVFTPREKKLLERLAYVYRDANGKDMSEVSHLPNQPWDRVFQAGAGKNAPIDYRLALGTPMAMPHDTEIADEQLAEFFSTIKNLSLSPTQ